MMRASFLFHLALLLAAVLLALEPVHAVTLGRAHSLAVVGRPLEVSVSVQADEDAEFKDACFSADVFYADARQDAARISLTLQPVTQPGFGVVRVVSASAVDEPVVTLQLRAGCRDRTVRTYVFLADMVLQDRNEDAIPRLPGPLRPPPSTASAQAPVPSPQGVEAPGVPGRQRPADGVASAPPRSAVPAKPRRMRAAAAAPVTDASVQPSGRPGRLKLVPMEQAGEPVLQSIATLSDAAVADPRQQALAAAHWRSLSRTAEDVVREQRQLQELESALKAQGAQLVRSGDALRELGSRLEAVQAQGVGTGVVYALSALLVACLAGWGFLWQRARAQGMPTLPWWRSRAGAVSASDGGPSEFAPSQQDDDPAASAVRPVLGPKSQSADRADVDIDLNLGDDDFSAFGEDAGVSRGRQAGGYASAHEVAGDPVSVSGVLRAINLQDMLDVRQQADFFMTLGQHEEAIGVLSASIHAGAANPLVYLDLLQALHALSRTTEYDAWRSEFNGLFTGRVPAYADFMSRGKSLEDYAHVLEQISQLWPSAAAVEFIERCLVRTEDMDAQMGFDLNAFRDLLTLHAVARRIDPASESGPIPFALSTTRGQLSPVLPAGESTQTIALPEPHVPPDTVAELDIPLEFADGDVDLDLDLSLPETEAAPVPGVTAQPKADDNLIDFDISGLSAGPSQS